MRRPGPLRVATLGLLLAGCAVAGVNGLRWRAEVVGLMAAGKIPDISRMELLPMLRPGSPFYVETLRSHRNPYRAIVAPDTSAGNSG